MTILVVFGSTPDLSWQELKTIIPTSERISDHSAVIHDTNLDPSQLINRLGGAIKVCRLAGVVAHLDAGSLVPILILEKFRTFGLSTVDIPAVSSEVFTKIKKELGRPTRFISGQLSSVVISKQHVQELVIFPYRGKFGVAKTVAVQDFASWATRDRGRPHADPKAGMLPPKVARTMVNIANPNDKIQMTKKTLLDPFCGMGTILAEALLVGWNVIGSDQSGEVVKKAQANLEWLGTQKNWKFFVSDATHISEKIDSVEAVVTEPFMGKPNVSKENVADIVKGLEKLYIGCLKDWQHVLKPDGKVVLALPRFILGEKSFFVKKVIDSCETLGYTVLAGPIEYSRPTAIVRRQIFVFQKKSDI